MIDEHDDPYVRIAHDLPNAVELGGALITMVEPHAGFEHAYNRWYEDDHFYAGATAGPWVFAGKRFVAPPALRATRLPPDSPVASPLDRGRYISLYWITAGHVEDHRAWSVPTLYDELVPVGRGFTARDHIYTAFHEKRFEVVLDPAPMRSVHALDHPYGGIVVEIVGVPGDIDTDAALERIRDEFVPRAGVRDAGQVIAFTQLAAPPAALAGVMSTALDLSRCVCLLWFVHATPEDAEDFAGHGSRLAELGLELWLVAPFVPTVPGTDMHVE